MQYLMKSGELFLADSGKLLIQIKSSFLGVKKTIYKKDSGQSYQTDIMTTDISNGKKGDVRYRTYIMTDSESVVLMEAHPAYAKEDDPDVVGWPICRVPKVDHADILICGTKYLLTMHNSQNYSLKDEQENTKLQIMHCGIAGGWTMDANECFSPEILGGLFIFCRYMEQENEFIVV